jgi:hypothetical protein
VKSSATEREYHHAPVTAVRTRDGQPGPPRNLSATQLGDTLILSWLPPADPKVKSRICIIFGGWIRIRISSRVKSWIRIRIKMKIQELKRLKI